MASDVRDAFFEEIQAIKEPISGVELTSNADCAASHLLLLQSRA
jgi:hypothetical protein